MAIHFCGKKFHTNQWLDYNCRVNIPDSTQPVSTAPPALLRAIAWALRPLVKLLLHRGIGYPQFADQMRAVFVQVAEEEFSLPSKRDTDSRISVLTGIYRRDVKRLRQELAASPAGPSGSEPLSLPLAASQEVSLSAKVMGLWAGLPEFTNAAGQPRPLPRLIRQGGELSFEGLVRQVNKDVRARTLLDEWMRRGAVLVDSADLVHLNIDALLASTSLDEKAYYLQQNVHDHLATLAHNLTGEGQPMLERCVIYSGLSEASVKELARLAQSKGMQALQAVNRRALALQQQDQTQQGTPLRINFGLYFYQDSTPPKDATHDE
ncbi:DUF6502 family protein [Vogesella sp. LIG4]|uniref:DUF6502 family protein n=1 Tax=Vogesella sp. LIG4 TaxID=1192162 RepID=UPI00081FF1EF|nr:DUF6502 family protein [Vogesella sp. LIG4]SCK26613.1 hypothetical protein PSELUDRAFT_3215 [Vogesella sp. LIG4]